MNLVPARTNTAPEERIVPTVRLNDDADIKEIYEFGSKLGHGSYGAVYEATHIETQTKWAIKEVYRPAAGTSKVDNEMIILKTVNHAHIIHLEAIYTSSSKIYLVTELCEGGDLKQLLQQKNFFTEDETRRIIFYLADAVAYLHKKAIMHRDLKLENILVKNSLDEEDGRFDIRVADFGMSLRTKGVGIENIQTEVCGTFIYMAPEMMSGRGYSHWCDNWSIGVIMYILLCGKPPFYSKSKKILLKKIMYKEVQFDHPTWDNISDAAKYLLTCLLKANPAYRMTAPLLLENSWITGDTSVPSGPSNVLEMMHYYMEHEEEMKTVEESFLGSSGDMLEPFMASLALSSKTNSTNPELSPEGDSPPSTSNKMVNKSGLSHQQDNSTNTIDTSRPLQTTQSHVGEKRPAQLSAKQRRRQDKKDLGPGQKPTSGSSKEEEQRHSCNSRDGLSSADKQLLHSSVISQNNTRKKKEKKNHAARKSVRKQKLN